MWLSRDALYLAPALFFPLRGRDDARRIPLNFPFVYMQLSGQTKPHKAVMGCVDVQKLTT